MCKQGECFFGVLLGPEGVRSYADWQVPCRLTRCYAELFSKASENLTLILSSVIVIYICVLCVMKMKESAQQIALDLFSFVFG